MKIEDFKEKYCNMCGSQRCPADEEAIQSCGHNKPSQMNKLADIRVEYRFYLEPMLVGLTENCSEEAFQAAVDGYMSRIYEELAPFVGAPDEIEIDLLGF